MTDEEKKALEEKIEEAPKKKGGLLKLILMGVGVLVLIGGVSFTTLIFLSDDKVESADDTENVKSHSDEADKSESDASKEKEGKSSQSGIHDEDYGELGDAELENMLTEEEMSMIDKIQSTLDILDFEPEMSELGLEILSTEDSIAEVNWIEQEKTKLSSREAILNKRQKKLETLDRNVSKKIIRLDQAESSRISTLAKLYDNMEARSVAQLMANLDDETVVSILPRMKIKNASAVLSLLPARRAANLSKQMITIAEK